MPGRVMVVDDERPMLDLLENDLRRRGHEVLAYTSGEEAFEHFGRLEVDVVLTDLNMPGLNGVDLCTRVVQNRPDVPVVVLTAFGSMQTAVASLRAGAFDFVTKPIELEVLARAVERALSHRSMQQTIGRLNEAVASARRFDEIVGDSAPMRRLYRQIEQVALTEATILVTGESGSGKELVARALHGRSRRKDRPFVSVSCAALPENLLEAELFGHVKGAFTDAKETRKGLFVQADGGTLFLDEVGEMPLPLQPKLLRALEERAVRPVGGDQESPVDVRIVAATNRDLETAVADGTFREDLFFRLDVINLAVPPLRARAADVLLLAQGFVQQFAARNAKRVLGLAPAAGEKLLGYAWPGNVRELRNAMECAVALTNHENITVEDLPERIRAYRTTQVLVEGHDPDELVTMEEVERRYIHHVLEACGGNKTLAARVLGFDRKTLQRKCQRYEQEQAR